MLARSSSFQIAAGCRVRLATAPNLWRRFADVATQTGKEALLVVDMQRDFCDPRGSCFVSGAPSILPAVKEAIAEARRGGVEVVWVVRRHLPSGHDVERNRQHLFASGGVGVCMAGCRGSELVGDLTPRPGEMELVKTRFSAFFQTPLASVLRRTGVSSISVCGVQLPNCVRATAFDALAHDFWPIRVLSDATASSDDLVHEANLRDCRHAGCETPTVALWARQLSERRPGL